MEQVNGDPEGFSSEKGGILMALGAEETRHPDTLSASTNSMINLDGRPHRQLRKEHMPYFTATYMKGLRDRVSAEVTRLLDTMAPTGRCDLVEKFSQRLPIFTLCEMLGVPESDRERFMTWIHFLEMAQQIAVEQIDQLAGLSEPNPQIAAFIELFNRDVRRDVRIRSRHAGEAPRRSAGGFDERDRQCRGGGAEAARRISRRRVAADRLRGQRHDAQLAVGRDEAVHRKSCGEGGVAGWRPADQRGARGSRAWCPPSSTCAAPPRRHRGRGAGDRGGREGDHVLRRRQSRSRDVPRPRSL
ncbi:hypothetical protein AB5I41_20055 [Sphingomonas sp. MMS24-JH45]